MTFDELIKRIADEQSSEGNLASNRERLARALWDLALGRAEKTVKTGGIKERVIPPARWAVELIVQLLQADGSLKGDRATSEVLQDLKKLIEADKLNEEFLS